jgi:mannose-6-phosphate isomerase-like protein (cupin superfamily)
MGEPIDLRETGQRFIFRSESSESLVFETYLPPGVVGLAAGGDAEQEQRFEILRGAVVFDVGGVEQLLDAGDRLTVPRGTPCRYRNASGELAHLVGEVRPALDFYARVRYAHCRLSPGSGDGATLVTRNAVPSCSTSAPRPGTSPSASRSS